LGSVLEFNGVYFWIGIDRCWNLMEFIFRISPVMAQHRRDSFEKGFEPVLEFNGVYSRNHRNFFEKGFEMISAWCLNLTGFISRISPVMAQHRKDPFERVLSQCWKLTGLFSESQRLFRERFLNWSLLVC